MKKLIGLCIIAVIIFVAINFPYAPELWWLTRKQYPIALEPIDVVIVCHPKDMRTLDLAIAGIRNYGHNIRRVIVVSETRLTDNAEWFDEAKYPFTRKDIAEAIFDNKEDAAAYLRAPGSRVGWIYQQLLKLYAPLVIPEISSNVLVLDADTIFLNSVTFMDHAGHALLTTGEGHHRPYFKYAKRLLFRFKEKYRQHSGIAHHMLLQRSIVEDLFFVVTLIHHMEPWKAICTCIDRVELQQPNSSTCSEYEIYFNFALTRTDQVKIRSLKWKDMRFDFAAIEQCRQEGFHYVSCHNYMTSE